MRITGIAICVLSLFLYSVATYSSDCPTLQDYLNRDDIYNTTHRAHVALQFGLPHGSSWEVIRPVIAQHYKLPADASWAEIREKRFELHELERETDDRDRIEWARGICLPDTASWAEIRERLDQEHAATK